MNPRTHCAALALLLTPTIAAPAAAQQSAAALVAPLEGPSTSTSTLPDFRAPQGDLRQAGEVRRNGLIAGYRIGRNLQIGVGRFTVPEIARPRTNVESDRMPTAIRSRDRGIAAVGFSLSF